MMTLLAIAAAWSCGGGAKDLPTQPGGGGRLATQIVVSPSNASVIVGQTVAFTAVAQDGAGATVSQTLTWSVGDPAIAQVTDGLVKGLKAGTTTVSASNGTIAGSASVTVLAAVAAVALTPSPDTVVINQTSQLSVAVTDAAGSPITGRTVTWASANEAIATVSTSGLVTGKALGTTTVTATVDGKVGTTTVIVRPIPVGSITVTGVSAPLSVGDAAQLTATLKDAGGNVLGQPVEWKSTNATVASVSTAGLVKALAVGTTTITASADGKTGSLDITVVPQKVASIAVAPAAITLPAGKSTALAVTLKDSAGTTLTGRTVTWTSADATKATVSATGIVTALSAGTVQITATSEGKSASSAVTVTDLTPPTVASLAVSPGSIDVTQASQRVTLTANVLDVGGSGVLRVDFAIDAPAGTTNAPRYACAATAPAPGGTPSNGIWSCDITVPVGAAAGNWSISIGAVDGALNPRTYKAADLAAAGMPSVVTVVNTAPDVTPPMIDSLQITPQTVDVTNSSQEIRVSARITDDKAGVARFDFVLRSPNGLASVGCSSVAPVLGTALRGTWTCTVTVPRGVQPGNWSIVARAVDNAFNVGLFAPGNYVITDAAPDTEAPTVTEFSVTPTTVDVSTGGKIVTAKARLRDAQSGAASFTVTATAPNNTVAQCTASAPTSGTPADGMWSCQMTIPPGSATGNWQLSVEATDAALNRRTLRTADLSAASFQTTITVTSP